MTSSHSPIPRSRALPSRQQGAVMLIGVALLLIITLFALAAIRGITIQERIAGGLYDRELAFSEAEGALRWAERQYMLNGSTPASANFLNSIVKVKSAGATDPVCNAGFCPNGVANTKAYFSAPARRTASQLTADAALVNTGANVPNFATGGANATSTFASPRYMAVEIDNGGACGDAVRINTVGFGRNPNTVVVLESIVCK